jgi:hypothetical protein
MEHIKKKIKLLINQDFMKNYNHYKNDLNNITNKKDLIIWINNNRHLFNIYFRQDLDKILYELLNNNQPSQ